uniref:Uncharacterized protein n=1 Tax=Romanomermis culicivorax TaxID=13658 RepID=A0A915KRD9_ROMCU
MRFQIFAAFCFLLYNIECTPPPRPLSKPCILNSGRVIQPGANFTISCTARCGCDKFGSGNFHCVPICEEFPPLPNCQFVRRADDFCCKHNQCPADVKIQNCSMDTSTTNAPVPWHIRVKNGGKINCAATMVPPSGRIVTEINCATENSTFVHSTGEFGARLIKKDPNLKIAIFDLVNASSKIDPSFHEINPAPGIDFCQKYPTLRCALHIASFDPLTKTFGSAGGGIVNNTECGITGTQSNSRCIFILQNPATCRDLPFGSGIYVQVGDYSYLVGILALDYKCGDKHDKLPFYDVCNAIEKSK